MAVLKRVFLAVVSAVLLAATANSVLAADPQWNGYGTLPQGTPAFSLAHDPGAPASVWVATNGQGLQHTDDGKAWKQVAAGTLPARLWKIEIDRSKGPGGKILVAFASQTGAAERIAWLHFAHEPAVHHHLRPTRGEDVEPVPHVAFLDDLLTRGLA